MTVNSRLGPRANDDGVREMKERLRLAFDSRIVAEVRAMATERGMSLSEFVEEHLLRVVRIPVLQKC